MITTKRIPKGWHRLRYGSKVIPGKDRFFNFMDRCWQVWTLDAFVYKQADSIMSQSVFIRKDRR